MTALVCNHPVSRSAHDYGFEDYDDASYSASYDRSDAFDELEAAYHEALEENWDGYGAATASQEAFFEARRFLVNLPVTIPSPEIDVTPQGRFLFCWEPEASRMFSLTLSSEGDIAYALLIDGEDNTGKVHFADFIPEQIEEELFRLYQ